MRMNKKGPATHFKAGNPARSKRKARGQIERRPGTYQGEECTELWSVRSQPTVSQDRLGFQSWGRQPVSEQRVGREKAAKAAPTEGFFTSEGAFDSAFQFAANREATRLFRQMQEARR